MLRKTHLQAFSPMTWSTRSRACDQNDNFINNKLQQLNACISQTLRGASVLFKAVCTHRCRPKTHNRTKKGSAKTGSVSSLWSKRHTTGRASCFHDDWQNWEKEFCIISLCCSFPFLSFSLLFRTRRLIFLNRDVPRDQQAVLPQTRGVFQAVGADQGQHHTQNQTRTSAHQIAIVAFWQKHRTNVDLNPACVKAP